MDCPVKADLMVRPASYVFSALRRGRWSGLSDAAWIRRLAGLYRPPSREWGSGR